MRTASLTRVPWGLFLLVLHAGFLFVGGCSRTQDHSNSGTLNVAVTITPQKWLVDRIGGDKVSCFVLVPQNQDHHGYMGTDADAARLSRCQVFFTIGLPVESSPWCQAVIRGGKLRVVSLAAESSQAHEHASDHAHDHSHDHDHAHGDGEHDHAHDHGFRHIWVSVLELIRMGQVIADTLSELDPGNQALYAANWAAAKKELQDLHAELQEKLLPLKGEMFFVFHPAWECFAEDYGLVQVAVESEGKDPSDREITQLQRQARQARIKVMLTQPQISSRAAQAVAEAGGLKLVEVDPLAADILAEIRRVAEILVSSYRGEETAP